MAFTLHLTVRGLCALVPGSPLPDPESPPPHRIDFLRIVLLNIQQGDNVGSFDLCEHDPVLEVQQVGGPEAKTLEGHDVRILGVDESQPGVSLNPTFFSVAEMPRVRSTFAVDPALFNSPPGRNDVVGRLRVTTSTAFGIDPTAELLIFETGPLPYSGHFATGVRLEIPMTGDEGSFVLTPLTGGPSQVIPIRPAEPGGIASATLSNLCDEAEVHPEHGADFVAFYKLEKGTPSGLFLFPEPANFRGEIFAPATTAGAGTCIPAVTNSHSGS